MPHFQQVYLMSNFQSQRYQKNLKIELKNKLCNNSLDFNPKAIEMDRLDIRSHFDHDPNSE